MQMLLFIPKVMWWLTWVLNLIDLGPIRDMPLGSVRVFPGSINWTRKPPAPQDHVVPSRGNLDKKRSSQDHLASLYALHCAVGHLPHYCHDYCFPLLTSETSFLSLPTWAVDQEFSRLSWPVSDGWRILPMDWVANWLSTSLAHRWSPWDQIF